VVHTGAQTKQIMNFGRYKLKLPRFERFWNIVMLGNFLIMMACCTFGTLANMRWINEYSEKYTYIFLGANKAKLISFSFLSYWLITNSIMALNVEISMQI
jgi:uncharacterized BrkB/YihY/UPF0761 family membrane protein